MTLVGVEYSKLNDIERSGVIVPGPICGVMINEICFIFCV